MRSRSWILFLSLSLSLARPLTGAPKENRDSIRSKIEDAEKGAEDSAMKERSILSELSEMDVALEDSDKQLAECRQKIEENETHLLAREEEFGLLEEDLEQRRADLSKAVRASYQIKGITAAQVFLGEEPMAEHLRRKAYMTAVADRLASLSEEAGGRASEAKSKADEIMEVTQRQKDLEAEISHNKERLLKIREERASLLKKTRSEGALRKKLLDELQEAEHSLGGVIQEKIATPLSPDQKTTFALCRGALPWPVRGKIIQGFGKIVDPELHTTIMHKGLGIEADRGDVVGCVHPGKVLFADWFKGYGKLVIVDHGEGYCSLYAHNDEVLVKPGDMVDAEQPLAKVGDTGSLGGTQLYFEIRKNNIPIDPKDWLGKKK